MSDVCDIFAHRNKKYTDEKAREYAEKVGIKPRPKETKEEIDERGVFIRQANYFTQKFGNNKEDLKAAPGKYGIYWKHSCHWSNRPVIVRDILGLEDVIYDQAVTPSGETNIYGHAFGDQEGHKDKATGFYFLSEAYKNADINYNGRATTPTIVDLETKKAVNNDYHAEEFLWSCDKITLKNVQAQGHYFGMNSTNIKIDNFTLSGNYAFDGAKNIEIRNARLNSKDSFWNCENVTIYDSTIIGEYLGWNSKNITLINCTIDSNQGMCYIDGIKMINCKLLNTDLSFELCKNVDAIINSGIDSVKNPINGRIEAKNIKEIILDKEMIDPNKTTIITKE